MGYKRINHNIILSITLLVGVVGLILGTFFDEQLSLSVVNRDNFVGILFTAIGPLPSLFCGVFAGFCMLFSPKIENKTKNILLKIVGILAIVILSFFAISVGKEYASMPAMIKHKTLYTLILTLFVILIDFLIGFYTYKNIKNFNLKILITSCITILIMIAFYAGVVEVIKYLNCRPRPRNVIEGIADFRKWYIFTPFASFKEGMSDCRSFVSGHAANSMCMVSLLPLVAMVINVKENKFIYPLCATLGFLFGIVTSISRIIAGAHYLSDVSGGIVWSVIAQELVINIVYKLKEKK